VEEEGGTGAIGERMRRSTGEQPSSTKEEKGCASIRRRRAEHKQGGEGLSTYKEREQVIKTLQQPRTTPQLARRLILNLFCKWVGW
jgi:hypothetical protein